MNNWMDQLDSEEIITLKEMANKLRKIKPKNWSVVFSDNEIIVRPADRELGKFSIIYTKSINWSVSFHSSKLNHWASREDFSMEPTVDTLMLNWMIEEIEKQS